MKEVFAPHLVPVAEACHEALLGRPPAKRPLVAFYRYVSTKSTVREREGRIHVRLSDHLQGAPEEALRGIIGILLCRLHRVPESRVPARDRQAYEAFVAGDEVDARRSRSRQVRGRKHIDPVGEHRSLLESYLRVTMDMDLLLPEAPRLSWSKERSYQRLGHQDPDHGAIVISRIFDDPDVPEYVLDYVVYHELLHIAIPPKRGSGSKRIVHSAAFRRAERRFPQWQDAEKWLTRLSRKGRALSRAPRRGRR